MRCPVSDNGDSIKNNVYNDKCFFVSGQVNIPKIKLAYH